MTKAAPPRRFTAESPELQSLLASIAEGEAERERERILPFAQIDLIRRARLGALRVPAEHDGGGGSLRTLFEVPAAAACCSTWAAPRRPDAR